ncbi:MAG: DUF4286 family protein [Acidimicrobiales bacterium]
MDDKRMRLLVFSNPVAGREDEFNDWYDNRHLHDVVAVHGVHAARRFELVDSPMAHGGPSPHMYLAVYEFDGDLDAIAADMGARSEDGRMPVSDSYDVSTTISSLWAPRGPAVLAPE